MPNNRYSKSVLTNIFKLRFSDTYWDDLRVAAQTTRVNPVSSKPDYGNWYSASTALKTLLFDGGSTEEVTFQMQLPHKYKLNTALKPHIHIVNTTTASGTVNFQFEMVYANVDGFFQTAAITLELTAIITANATGIHKAYIVGFGEIDPAAYGLIDGVSCMFSCALRRTGAADTLADDIGLLEFDVHYQIDAIGSEQEYIKDPY